MMKCLISMMKFVKYMMKCLIKKGKKYVYILQNSMKELYTDNEKSYRHMYY